MPVDVLFNCKNDILTCSKKVVHEVYEVQLRAGKMNSQKVDIEVVFK